MKRISDYRPAPWVGDLWLEQLAGLNLPESTKRALADPATLDDALAELPAAHGTWLSCRHAHDVLPERRARWGEDEHRPGPASCSKSTSAPSRAQTPEEVDAHLKTALGDLANRVEISTLQEYGSTRSATDNPLWEALGHQVGAVYPGSRLSPGIFFGATDARYFRDKGAIAMGAALYSPEVTFETVRRPLPWQRRAGRRRFAWAVYRAVDRGREGASRLSAAAAAGLRTHGCRCRPGAVVAQRGRDTNRGGVVQGTGPVGRRL